MAGAARLGGDKKNEFIIERGNIKTLDNLGNDFT
jgi:hypothetical protein